MIQLVPSSMKHKGKENNPGMHSVGWGNHCFHCCAEGFVFGIHCHIEIDAASGLVHSFVRTAANVHELNIAADRLHGEASLMLLWRPRKPSSAPY